MIFLRFQLFLIFLARFLLVSTSDSVENANETKSMTEKAYSSIFKHKRKGMIDVLKIIMEEDVYEHKYKLIESAYNKLLRILDETCEILTATTFDPTVDAFPSKNTSLADAIAVTLENTCLISEIILHVPDISYRVLYDLENKLEIQWKDLINWCIKYTRYFNDRIVDAKSQELLRLVEQEINPELRTDDFINPYRIVHHKPTQKKKKKPIKKGPRMVQRDEF